MTTPLTAPLDATHTESTLAIMQIRDRVRWMRSIVATWVPAPCPPKAR